MAFVFLFESHKYPVEAQVEPPPFYRVDHKDLSTRPGAESEKAMATQSGTLAWKIPWAEEPGGLPSMGSHRVRQRLKRLSSSSRYRVGTEFLLVGLILFSFLMISFFMYYFFNTKVILYWGVAN